ncbi:MAG: alpha/beta fold hydrolase, partial [Lysobacter sp.]
MSEITTVLLHGAGTGAWVWEPVINQMTSPVVALDVPSRHAGATPDGCAAVLVAELDRRGIDRVVLVVHSLAGVLVSALASRLEPRLKQCVYVGAT